MADRSPAEDDAKPPAPLSRKRYIAYVIILVVCTILLYWLVVRHLHFFLVPSRSMEPTLYPDDHIVTVGEPTYKRGDVVVIVDPTDAEAFLVKRIVGVGGDHIKIDGGALFIDGAYASEPYIKEPIKYDFPQHKPFQKVAPYTVPKGDVFVLGDNRNLSDDSSKWTHPSIPVQKIIGKVQYIYLPFSRIRAVRSYPLVNSRGE